MTLTWGSAAEGLALVSAVVLWRQAYRASIIKIARGAYTPTPNQTSAFGQLKHWLARRQEQRDQEWTETDHLWLITGLGLGVLSSLIKLFVAP